MIKAYEKCQTFDSVSLAQWEMNSWAKIALKVNSNADILKVAQAAQEEGINYYLLEGPVLKRRPKKVEPEEKELETTAQTTPQKVEEKVSEKVGEKVKEPVNVKVNEQVEKVNEGQVNEQVEEGKEKKVEEVKMEEKVEVKPVDGGEQAVE